MKTCFNCGNLKDCDAKKVRMCKYYSYAERVDKNGQLVPAGYPVLVELREWRPREAKNK